jgi:glycosidase
MNYGWDYKDELVKVWQGAPASDLIKADKAEYDSLPSGKIKLRFTTNHDHSTEATPCKEFTNDQGAMAAYVASIFPHGGALIYSSQEVGYPEPINFFKYVPVDWTAKSEIYKEYQTLIRLYNEHPALRKGTMTAYPDKDVFVFEKTDAAERFLILVNIRNVSNIIQIPENWRGHEVDDEVTRKHTKLDENFELAPFEYMIFAY